MAYTPNEHITIDEQFVVFRGECPVYTAKIRKVWDQIMACC